jgi:hypothetical protein
MKKLMDSLMEFKQKLENFNIELTDDEASNLINQFNEEEKSIFEKIIHQISQENLNFIDIIDEVDEKILKELISLLLNNPKFLEKTHELFLNKSIE